MYTATLLSLGVVAAVLVSVQAAQECNARNSTLIENDLTYNTFSAVDITTIFPATLTSGAVTIVDVDDEDNTGGIIGTFWNTEKRRISDGFKATFTFRYTGKSDGIAFVIQNDKIQDIVAGGAQNLGFSNGLNKYIAVGIDLCPQLARPERYPCDETSQVNVSLSALGDADAGANLLPFGDALIDRTVFPENTLITITVYLLAEINQIMAFAGPNEEHELLIANMSGFTNVEDHFGSRFGHFGFTASNGFLEADAGTFVVESLVLDKFISEVRVSVAEQASFPVDVELGEQIVLDVDVVDSCNVKSNARKIALNITADKINAQLQLTNADGLQVIEPSEIVDRQDGSFSLVFLMPPNVLGSWTFVASIPGPDGDIDLQNVPLANAVVSVTPPPEGLPLYGLILLITLLVILVALMVYVIRRLYRYRLKLKEHEEDIAFGQEKRAMDKLEESVLYVMNPLMGTYEEMEAKLAANQKILADLRKGDMSVENIDAAVADLKKKNAELRKQLKDLKIQVQKEEALKNRMSLRKYKGKGKKQEFSQEAS